MSNHLGYGNTVKPLIGNLYQAVVGLGLLAISIQYVQLAHQDQSLLEQSAYWFRWMLLVGVLGFSCYCMLSYQATSFAGAVPAGRLLAMYALEIVHVSICGWQFALLSPSSETDPSRALLGPAGDSLSLIFLLTAIWHATVLLWYVAAPSGSGSHVRSLGIHGAFSLVHAALAGLTWWSESDVGIWLGGSAYVALVAALFATQGLRTLRGEVLVQGSG